MKENLFVLVSTGQRVANIPPVLEYARPGDHVLWVESDEAVRNGWTPAPRALLEDYGLLTVRTVRVRHVNDPALMTEALSPFANEARGRYETTYLVANGGTKLSPLGLFFGLELLQPRFLYGDDRPVVHNLYPPGLDAPAQVAPYTRHTLDLPEILRVNGYVFAHRSRPLRLWPGPLPGEHQQEQYGVNEEYTYQLHRDHHAVSFCRHDSAADPAHQQVRIPFSELNSILTPEQMQRWRRTVQQVAYALNRQNLENLYHATLNLAEQARLRAAVPARAGLSRPASDLGRPFERAVARRVCCWLEREQHPAVQSVWSGVVVAREPTPHQVEAEFDVLIVLKNGNLVALECKTGLILDRDLEANFHRLRQATTRLALPVVVLPLYTRPLAGNEDWARRMHAVRERVAERFGRNHALCFTWPGQPTSYVVPGSDPPQQAECPEFEEALEALLWPYRP